MVCPELARLEHLKDIPDDKLTRTSAFITEEGVTPVVITVEPYEFQRFIRVASKQIGNLCFNSDDKCGVTLHLEQTFNNNEEK